MRRFTKPLALLLALVMVVGLLPMSAFAAAKPSDDNFAARPSNAKIFFTSGTSEAIGTTWPSGYTEAYTFNTATYWDIYQQELGVPQGTHEVDRNSPNYGLTLQSSTDAAIVKNAVSVQENATATVAETSKSTKTIDFPNVSLTGDSGAWGNFDAKRVLQLGHITLGAGANDIKIAFNGTGADIRTLKIRSGDTVVASLTPSGRDNNVKSDTTNANDRNVKSSVANNQTDGWMETVGTAAYKCADDGSSACFGYLDNASVIYHFAGASAANITEGDNYTLELEYTRGEVGTFSTNVTVTVTGTFSSSESTEPSDPTVRSFDALRIDYESAKTFTYQQYATQGTMDTVFPYSDGSGTIVGWGGAVSQNYNKSKNAPYRLVISLRTADGTSLDDVLPYIQLQFVDAGGKRYYKNEGDMGPTVADLKKTDFGGDYSAFQKNFYPGFTTFVTPNIINENVEGMKIIFQTPDGMADRSGTIEIGYIGFYTGTFNEGDTDYNNFLAGSTSNGAWTGKPTNWTAFGPFSYDDATIHPYTETNAVAGTVKPLLRLPGNTTNQSYKDNYQGVEKTGEGTVSGSNLLNNKWHLWNMSTSDANIVDKSWSDKNGTGTYNALEIKYRNDSAHRTTTSLTLDTGKRSAPTGQWLVINLKGEAGYMQGSVRDNAEEVLKIGVKLNEGTSIPLSEFRIAPAEGDTPYVDASKISDGYQTIYYYVGNTAIPSAGLSKVEFDFSKVGSSGAGDTHRIYVKDIYLLTPSLSISKDGPAVVDQGAEFEYSLYVWNSGEQAVTDAYTVTDTLPSGLNYVAGSAQIAYRKNTDVSNTYSMEPTVSGSKLSWTINDDLANTEGVRDNVLITFKVSQANSAAPAGTAYVNSATVTLNGDTFTSREVITRVREKTVTVGNLTYYAEVNQLTTLPMGTVTITTGDVYETKETTHSFDSQTIPNGKTDSGDKNGWIDGGANYQDINFGDFTVGVTGKVKLVAEFSMGDISGITLTLLDENDNPTATAYTLTPDGNGGSIENIGTVVSTTGWCRGQSNHDINTKAAHTTGTSKGCTVTYEFNSIPAGKYGVVIKGTSNTGPGISLTATYLAKKLVSQGSDKEVKMVPTSVVDSTLAKGVEANVVNDEEGGTKLNYKSSVTGCTTFDVNCDVDGSAQTVTVTVYNYQVKDHVYVLDYGLPVDLTDTSAGNNSGLLEDATLTVNGAETGYAFNGLSKDKRNGDGKAGSSDYTTPYGDTSLTLKNGTAKYTAAPESEALKVTFTPTEFMSDVDTFYYGVQVSKNDTVPSDATNATPVMEGEIKVMPANVVYYEDNFVAVDYEGENKTEGKYTDPTQSNDQSEQYGHDDAYELDVTDSAGSSTMLTAKKDENGKYVTKAKFTFKGTGFEIVGRSTDESTVLTYIITEAKKTEANQTEANQTEANQTKVVKMGVVDTLYRNGDLYQIPVIHVDDLVYGEYDVTIGVSFSGVDENGNAARSVFYLDGIRIFNPLGKEGNNAYLDSEKGATIVNVRDMIVGNGTVTENGIVDSEGYLTSEYAPISGSTATLMKLDEYGLYVKPVNTTESTSDYAEEVEEILKYLNSGPNNEVYLGCENQQSALAFVVRENEVTDRTLQIEAKAAQLFGTNTEAPTITLRMITKFDPNDCDCYVAKTLNLVDPESSATELSSSTGMYYRIPVDQAIDLGNGSYLIVLLGDSDGNYNLSLSNLKYKGYDLVLTPIENKEDNLVMNALGDYLAFPQVSSPVLISLEQTTTAAIRKQAWVSYKLVVDASFAEDITSAEDLYVTTGGTTGAKLYSVKTGEDSDGNATVSFRIKAPNAVGSFTVEVHYVEEDGTISSEFISTELKVVASKR